MSEVATKPAKQVGSVFDLPGKSLNIVKENWKVFAIVNILGIASAIFSTFDTDPAKNAGMFGVGGTGLGGLGSGQELATKLGVGAVVLILFLAIAVFLYAMSTSLEVRASKGEKPTLNTIFEDGKKYWLRLLGLNIVSGLIVLVGLVLLIIPGLFAFGRLVFGSYHMVDKDLGIEDSMKASNNMSKGRAGAVWSAILLFVAIMILAGVIGGIPVLGPLVSVAATIAFSLVIVLRYRELKGIGA